MLWIFFACEAPALVESVEGDSVPDDTAETDTEPHDSGDSGEMPPTYCESLGLTARLWDDSGAEISPDFDLVAPDFALGTTAGEWRWSEHYTGCDSLLAFAYYSEYAYPDLLDKSDLKDWLTSSPRNAHYFIYSLQADEDSRLAEFADIADKLERVYNDIDDDAVRTWWGEHLHFVNAPWGNDGTFIGEIVTKYADSTVPEFVAVDRFQRAREVGYLADPATGWSHTSPAFLSYETQYFNMEADRQARLDAETATVLTAFVESAERVVTLTFPESSAMEQFDTLELDLSFLCGGHPDAVMCGEWDYLAYVYLCENDNPETSDTDESTSCTEIGRFITAYARPGRWVVDASPFLAMLQTGGEHVVRVDSANAPYISLDLRLSNRGKGYRPVAIEYLWGGGAFNEAYNEGREEIRFTPPNGATHAEIFGLITGHGYGKDRANCAEFCNHQHEFRVNDSGVFMAEFPETEDVYGCGAQVVEGTVPNQYGTWVYGRGGWCPGKQVDPFIAAVTDSVLFGEENAISYRGLFEGEPYVPEAYDSGQGFGAEVRVASWLVFYE